MTILKFLSTEKLVEYLEEELRTLLNERGVYEVEHYGWLDDDVPDPEYFGHAMWQIAPPNVLDQDGERSPVLLAELVNAGNEFMALMKSGRLSLGHALLYEDVVRDNALDDTSFRHHHADAMNKLRLASMKIREFFVLSAYNESVGAYDRRLNRVAEYSDGMDASDYLTPFRQAEGLFNKEVKNRFQLENCFGALLPNIDKVEACCRAQDEVVRPLSVRGEKNDFLGYDLATGPDVDGEIQNVTGWYKTLVETSNLVFMVEYAMTNSPCEIVEIELGAGQVHTVD